MIPAIKNDQLTSQKQSNKKLIRFFQFPLLRIIQAILFIIPVFLLNNIFVIFVLEKSSDPWLSFLQIAKTLVLIPLLIISYGKYTKTIENRSALEFNRNGWVKEILWGMAIGSGMVILITAILFISGAYSVESINSPFLLINRFFRYAQGSFVEDLLFTIIFFRLLEEFTGTTIAYICVTLLFGGLHAMNDNATLQTSLFISVQQITLLGPFILTRRMWMGWAVHFSWNFFQAGVFGMANSGMDQGGFITPLISGPEWLTGGFFGIEASWLSLFINLMVGLPILIYAVKMDQWKKLKKHSI